MPDHTAHACQVDAPIAELNQLIRGAFAVFGGKWKLEILWMLSQRTHRFNELMRAIPGVTQHMLTAQLRELERDGLVVRTVYPEVPPRVEYEITDVARRLAPVFDEIIVWMRDRAANGLQREV
jgi:DNA-binding HxlR family transcriptional regulator